MEYRQQGRLLVEEHVPESLIVQKTRPTILVVDDSVTTLTLTTTLLRQYMFEVITSADAQEAEQKVVAYHPDCIILDVVLPKGNGFQLCRRIKSYEHTHHIPVIFLTQKSTPTDRAWGLRQGAHFYMTKPFQHEELIANVKQCLFGLLPS